MRKKIGPITILILAIFPIIRWIAMPGWAFRFLDINTTATSIGQITGLVGMTLFSINLILSGRFKFIDKYFFGMDKAYNQHHQIGVFSFSLLLFHPLFLAVKYINISMREAALFLFPGPNIAVTWGIIALLLMIALMVATFYIKLKYNHWKISHKFLVLVFIFTILHTLLITSDISRDAALRYYILGMAFVGLACGSYRAFISKYFHLDHYYIVKRIEILNKSIITVELEPTKQAMQYQAGQFVFVRFYSAAINTEIHPFSIASSPSEKVLKLTIKALGDYTNQVNKIKPGDGAVVEGPFGKFNYTNFKSKDQVWIAGGIGITPFVGMAKSLDPGQKVDLYYSVQNKDEAVLLDDLIAVSKTNKNFKIIPWYSSEKGYLNAKAIYGSSGNFAGKDILVCGPPVFMNSLKKQLMELGVSSNRIHWEKFSFI